MADVVQRAGGSLATLYKLFGNKVGLLTAVVQERARSGESLIAEIEGSAARPAEALYRLGKQLREQILDEENVALSRIVIAYSIKDAEFASDFHRRTLHRAQQALSEVFESWRARGMALVGDPQMLAAIFLSVVIYELYSEAIRSGTAPRLGDEDLKEKVDFFCRGAGLSS